MKFFQPNTVKPSINPYLLFGVGSMQFHKVCSKFIYDGDNIQVLGILSFNQNADQWEIINPLAIFLGGEPSFRNNIAKLYD